MGFLITEVKVVVFFIQLHSNPEREGFSPRFINAPDVVLVDRPLQNCEDIDERNQNVCSNCRGIAFFSLSGKVL